MKSWNIPWSVDKALERVVGAERLGVWFDERVGPLGVTTARLIHDGSLGLFLLGRTSVTRLSLQIFGGREAHSLQPRRCLFSYCSEFWAQVGGGRSQVFLKAATKREMLSALGLCPCVSRISVLSSLATWPHRARA